MVKELPLAEPPKTSHQFLAFPLSIIMLNEKGWNWFYSEFIQMLTFHGEDERIMLNVYNYGQMFEYEPLEHVEMLPYRLNLGKDIIGVIKCFINNGYYVDAFCDDHLISTMNIREHRYHEVLIYGYDDDSKLFKVYAYNGPKLKKFDVSYDDFLKAYYSDVEVQHKRTILYKPRNIELTLNLEKIKWHLLDYIECVDTIKRERPYNLRIYQAKWGFDIYDEIINMYKWYIDRDRNIPVADAICLYEHKKDMLNRAIYLNEHSPIKCTNDILNNLARVRDEAYKIVNLVIKINQKQRKNIDTDFKDLVTRVELLKDFELIALNKYYDLNKDIFRDI